MPRKRSEPATTIRVVAEFVRIRARVLQTPNSYEFGYVCISANSHQAFQTSEVASSTKTSEV
jgi:hypothetical protein